MSTATTPLESTVIPAGKFEIDRVHSSVGFEVKHMISTFRGSFREYDATLESSDGLARLVGSAKVASVDVRDENLAAHLQGPDFFDAENHPEIRFGAERLDVGADGALSLDGELTIRGITRAIHATGRFERVEADMTGSERLGIALETIVDRRDFGIEWNAALPKGGFALENDVRLVVNLELVPAEA
jgi:polyisoprenoid-binding protein YceI